MSLPFTHERLLPNFLIEAYGLRLNLGRGAENINLGAFFVYFLYKYLYI